MKKSISLSALSLLMFFISCEEILLEEDISASTVDLLAPANTTTIETSPVSFHWTAVEGASSYHFQIATPGFESPRQIMTDSILEGNWYSEVLLDGDYEWRVKAFNSGYGTAFSTAAFRVETNGDFSDQKVNLFSPSDNYLANTNTLTLNWGELEGATVYRVQIVQNGEVVEERTTAEGHIELQFPEGESTWRVRAENESSNTAFSSRVIFVDTVEPQTPQLIRPEDDANLPLPDVTFEWERNATSGSEEIDSIFVFRNLELSELAVKERVTTSYNTTLERGETYYWFMRSWDTAGNRGERSEVFSFTIE